MTTGNPAAACCTTLFGLIMMAAFALGPFLVFFGIIAFFVIIAVLVARPHIGPGGLFFGGGAKQDLDPVEASVVLGINPLRILGMVTMSLVRKGRLEITSSKPLRVRALPEAVGTHCPSCGGPLDVGDTECDYCGSPIAKSAALTYYEEAFMQAAISSDGTLDEGGSNGVVRLLESSVESKMAGSSAEATRAFYQNKLAGMWKELEHAPDDAKGYEFSKDSGWLALDDQFDEKTNAYSSDKRVSKLRTALKETVEDSNLDESKIG